MSFFGALSGVVMIAAIINVGMIYNFTAWKPSGKIGILDSTIMWYKQFLFTTLLNL